MSAVELAMVAITIVGLIGIVVLAYWTVIVDKVAGGRPDLEQVGWRLPDDYRIYKTPRGCEHLLWCPLNRLYVYAEDQEHGHHARAPEPVYRLVGGTDAS